MAAACPELCTVTAEEVFEAARYGAVAGWALPSGHLPVAAGSLGIVNVTRAEWDRYVRRCADERDLDKIFGPALAQPCHGLHFKPRFG